jgi:hypothetical protein
MVSSRFFHFRRSQPLHNILTFIFRSLTEVLVVCFVISSCTVYLRVLLSALALPRCNPSFRPRFLMPLHSGCAQHPFLKFLLQHHPWSNFSIISVRPSVLYDCVPYTGPLLHSGSSLCDQQPVSSGTHHHPGSISAAVSGTLQLRACPHTIPSVL